MWVFLGVFFFGMWANNAHALAHWAVLHDRPPYTFAHWGWGGLGAVLMTAAAWWFLPPL